MSLWNRRPSARFRPAAEGLEPRLTLSVSAAAAVAMTSASTVDSKGVTVSYEVAPSAAGEPLTIGIYRSADSLFDAADVPVATETDLPSTPGSHTLTIPIAGGLTPNPEHPYILAVANPAAVLASGSASASAVASFRVYTIGVVTHGGIENPAWKNGPAWELVMARSLLNEGYDAVIPFNWVDRSNTPGDAVKQAPRLVRQILDDASQFPPGTRWTSS